ncbi:PWWP domain-containing protein 1 [Elaeis guineensis]|uniref:Uncharacterized protein LOC105032148 n=1 Tax=Elaeis guineensis var. tenera TaxID=51953 RepID=A0A6I9Q8S6_ELAGV|nr:uncharacterized protein LOC105032148 [Elaeis guineensis]
MEGDPATAAADLAFVEVEDPEEEPRVSDESAAGAEIDPSVERISDNATADLSPGDAKMDVEAARVSESDSAMDGSLPVDAGIERLLPVQEKTLVLNHPVAPSQVAAPPEIWMHGFEVGDMVWGKVKSHPWWPGYIFNVHFAPPDVRRTRKQGHALVAFFGDSSYGWFVPDELIPFDPYYLEKSKQTTSRNFVKSVDEAEDEVSRRAALGLTCCCRNAKNFRYFGFPGYVRVDVPGYERGADYSMKQIQVARDSFVPEDALSFLQQLALAPLSEEPVGIDFIRSKARLVAYRKAVYEEYDETYPQAFGVEPVRPSPTDTETPDQSDYFAPRAIPLSGQLRIAETLGERRVSSSRPASKAPKVPSSSSKKNKYVLKRREERGEQRASPIGGPFGPSPLPDLRSPPAQAHGTPPPLVHYVNTPQASNFVPQKRPQIMFEGALVSSVQKETKSVAGHNDVQQAYAGGSPVGTTPSLQTQAFDERRLKNGPSMTDGRMETEPGQLDDRSNNLRQEAKSAVDLPAEEGMKAQAVPAVDRVMKKDKVRKRPREDGGSVGPDDTGDIKKKKKKKNKILNIEAVSFKDGGESRGKVAGKSLGNELGHGEVGRTESQRRDDGVARTSDRTSASAPQPGVDLGSLSLEFPQILNDLRELALDPFYEMDRDAPNIALQVFCKFRIQVYQKSVVPAASEPDMAELRSPRVSAGLSLQKPGAGNADMASTKEAKDQRGPSSSALKPSKPGMKPDDPAKAGRKRAPSDRQEELNAKKVKKMNQLKALGAEKKAGIHEKMPEPHQRNQKESNTVTTSAASAKPNNKAAAEPFKKQEPPPPPPTFSPTALVLKFPPRTTLPSVATLKAKFARFGSLIEGATRVYWKSYSCKVVFKHKPDAQAAINYARKYDLLFGQFKVQYHIRELDPSTLEPLSDTGRLRPTESRPNDGPSRLGNGGNGNGGSLPQPRALPYQQQRGAPAGQLKSILKKPGDEGGPSAGNAAREAPQRVTFLLDGDNRAAPPVVAAGSDGSAGSYAAGPSSSSYSSLPTSSSLTAGPSSSIPPLDSITSRNPRSAGGFLPQPPPPMLHSPLSNPPRTLDVQHLPPPPPLPQSISLPPPLRVGDSLLPLPPPLPHMADRLEARGSGQAWLNQPQPQHNGQQEAEGDFRNQMLTLLIRCRDIVTHVNSSLGYVPYHPL